MLIDMMLILAVTKVPAHLRFTVRQPAGHAGVGGIGEHCICMAFTSKIGA